jgi:aminoglycoside/choline kinase family phosphotransferase
MHHFGKRFTQLRSWLEKDCALGHCSITAVSGDASFRRYFRALTNEHSYIVMDAPPDHENCESFIEVTHLLEGAGLQVPQLFAADLNNGFLLLSDLGDELYLNHLNVKNADVLYADALQALLKIQTIDPSNLPPYDRARLVGEMELFREWFLSKHLGLSLSPQHQQMLDYSFKNLADLALSQPQVFVHRDYHSRNLMLTPENNPGMLDYQDAVRGPVSYDLLSLLKDSYISWPRDQVIRWALGYRDSIVAAGIIEPVDDKTFIRWFDLMGVQRQLKVCGIFARLFHRDAKPNYLQNIPVTFSYLKEASALYIETEDLSQLLLSLDIESYLKVQVSA